MKRELVIDQGMVVTLHFSLGLENGDILDSNFDTDPATFIFGDGNLLPGFEEALIGLKKGEKELFEIPPEKGFGQHNPGNIQILPRENFEPNIKLETGLVVSFTDPAGAELPGVVKKIAENEISVDFNHPLAGRIIYCDVEIIDIKPSVTH